MNRFESYFGIIIAILFGVTLAISFGNQSLFISSQTTPALTSPPSLANQPKNSPSPQPVATAAPTAVPTALPTVPKVKAAPTQSPRTPTVAVPLPTATPVTSAALDASAAVLRSALVNIICYVPQGTQLHSISGSGIFIDPKGIILTNAHIGVYFLLADKDVSCTIRAGSPAIKKYTAAPIYISPPWIQKNADVITKDAPSGTGEYDFALLAVTKSATSDTLPASFPYVPMAKNPPLPNTPIIIASYGAQFLESSQIQSSLFPTIVFGSVKDVYTFAKNTIDVLALGGSAAAQEGSSGGGVADASGALVGTITTSTIEGATDTRSLSAITASYIRAEYATETGEALDLLLNKPTAVSIANFSSQVSSLEAILTANLP